MEFRVLPLFFVLTLSAFIVADGAVVFRPGEKAKYVPPGEEELNGNAAELFEIGQKAEKEGNPKRAIRAYRNAGRYYLAKGDDLQRRNSSESIPAYERALQVLLRSIAIDKSTRAEYDRQGGADWARHHSAAPATTKGDPDAHWMLAVAYGRLGKIEQASTAAGESGIGRRRSRCQRRAESVFPRRDQIRRHV